MTDRPSPAIRRALPIAGFAALCYLPLLATRPGWISADTKSYLYLDPARLLSRAWSMWDPQIGLGTVSHQTIGYLWPMGPWYWLMERLGIPDWVAQRLWWGTLLFAAGLGVVYLLRRFEWPPVAIWPAAVVYAMSPYVLTHIGRLSGVLMPFTGLPWLLGLTVMAVRTRRWRHPALFALVVTTVGSINLTALALAGLGPVMWVVYVAVTRQEPLAHLVRTVGRLAVLTLGASAWWLAGLWVQATHGVDIVRYTETAEVVARTSTAFEIVRGLGYWFFYGGDKLQLWLEVSYEYTQRPWVLVVTFLLPLLALAAVSIARFRHRGFFIAMVVIGAIVGVGGHRWTDPTPIGSAIQWFVTTPRGLAFRSLPRVVPLVALGSAVLIGAAVGSLAARWRQVGRPLAVGVVVLGVLGLAPLWQRSLVNDNLSRREIPEHWAEAARAIDAGGTATRVLELPGNDFAAYRWGMTVDPITPGLTERPVVARELVPHGSPMGTDLLNALDLRLQENTVEPAALAPVARMMRVGDLVVRSDTEFERHNIARPRVVWDLVSGAPGLGEPVGFGEPVPNEAGPILQHLDEQWLLGEGLLPDPPPVALVPVADPVPIVGLKPVEAPLLLAGDGAGLVDAAAAGLVTGHELVRYTGALSETEIREALAGGSTLVVTDGNRKRGERWGSLRHNRGHTERVDEEALREDLGDNRLPRFPDAPTSAQTVTLQRGGVTADASAYGNAITYAGEERAARAIDGDPRTAWAVGVFSDARGERLRLRLDEPLTLDWIRVLQISPDDSNRQVSRIRLTFDGTDSVEVDLDPSSWTEPGQLVEFPTRTVGEVELTLLSDTAGDAPRFGAFGPVGIRELVLGPDSPVIDEIVRVPTHALDAAGDLLTEAPLHVVLTRLRQDPTDRTRDDEERSIRRLVELPTATTMEVHARVRLSARADDPVIDRLIGQEAEGVRVRASDRMDGSRTERAAAAFDGDDSTAWTTPWGQPADHWVQVDLDRRRSFDHLDLTLVTDGRHSIPSRVRVLVDDREVTVVDLPALEHRPEPGATTVVPVTIPPTTGSSLRLDVLDAEPVTSIDWTEGRPLAHPIAIAELGIPGVELGPPAATIDTGCRDDLLVIGGEAVTARVVGTTADALDGRELTFETCGETSVELPAGATEILVSPGVDTGLDVDQLVLTAVGRGAEQPPMVAGTVEILSARPDRLQVRVDGLEPGRAVWFILGQSFNEGWSARAEGATLLTHESVDAYANGWMIAPDADSVVLDIRFEPQRRVNIALGLSAISIMACLAIVARGRRGRGLGTEPAGPHPAAGSWREILDAPGTPVAPGVAVLTVGAVLAITLVVAPPIVALGLAVTTAIGTRVRRARLVIGALPGVLFGMAAIYVVTWQARYDIGPGMEWVTELERAHPVALAAVLALPLGPVLDHLWSHPPERDTDAADH